MGRNETLSAKAFSAIIADIYDGAQAPELWSAALDGKKGLLGANTYAVYFQERSGGVRHASVAVSDQQMLDDFLA